MRQAFACVCGITPHIARRILETAPPDVEQGIDADSVLPGALCPETPGGEGGQAKASTDVTQQNALLRNEIIVALTCAVEGRSGLEFRREMERLHRLNAEVGTKYISKHFKQH